jgi:anti-sigma factor RsiW
MTTIDADLELLEQYLDGAVEGSELLQLRDRLSQDAELSDAFKELQAQRTIRQAVWKSMEPDNNAAQQLVWRVRGAVLNQPKHRSSFMPSQWRLASFGSAAAACMVLGFFFGRMGHGGAISGPATVTEHGTPVAEVKPISGSSIAQSGFVPVGTLPKISVPVTNEYGQVVAWQTFDNPEQAKNFTEDLHRAHSDSNAPATAGQIKTVGEQVPF